MIASYSLEEVAAAHLPAEWSDGVRWLKRGIGAGKIPAKQLSRGVFRMTDAHIAVWLESTDRQLALWQAARDSAAAAAPAVEEVAEPDDAAKASIIGSLSPRSRRRIKAVS